MRSNEQMNAKMGRIARWWMALVCLGLLAMGRGVGRAESAASPAANAEPASVSLKIRCSAVVWKVGDEIPIEFIVTNVGTNDYEYADRNYDRSGRMPEYRLTATSEKGEEVPDPRARWRGGIEGGLSGQGHLRPGRSFSRMIALNRWALLKEPGKYTVTGYYRGQPFRDEPAVETKSAPLVITVEPRTDKEMDEYIRDLTHRLAGVPAAGGPTGGASPECDRWVMKLMYTCSPKIVPALLQSMSQSGQGGFWEGEALLYYVPRSEATRRRVLEAGRRHGLAPNLQYVLEAYGCGAEELRPLIERSLAADSPRTWAAGALAAQKYGDDAFTERLTTIAIDLRAEGRDSAIYALAAHRTDGSVQALKLLLRSPDEHIRATTRRAIRTAYLYRGNWRGAPLKPEDFDETFRKAGPP